jgi:hypothetical protein
MKTVEQPVMNPLEIIRMVALPRHKRREEVETGIVNPLRLSEHEEVSTGTVIL